MSGPIEDPLRAFEPMEHWRIYLPLGLPVEIQTNSPALLDMMEQSWPSTHTTASPVVHLTLGVTHSDSTDCPHSPLVRGQGHLFSLTADQGNFLVCDLRARVGFGWLTTAALAHPSYLRYCLVEAAVLTMLSTHHVTPLHAACLTSGSRGMLLSGVSGAGKSTLAYACAKAGFRFTSDDCSYLLRDHRALRVIGNCRQIRFRPSAQILFPEIAGRALTPRVEGKPSIEIPVAELEGIDPLPEAQVHAVVLLDRRETSETTLTQLPSAQAIAYMEASLFPMPLVRELQRPSLERLAELPFFSLRYQDLTPAIAALRSLAAELPA